MGQAVPLTTPLAGPFANIGCKGQDSIQIRSLFPRHHITAQPFQSSEAKGYGRQVERACPLLPGGISLQEDGVPLRPPSPSTLLSAYAGWYFRAASAPSAPAPACSTQRQ